MLRNERKKLRNFSKEKLPEWTKRLNASQRMCLTKTTKTGERDMAKNLKASERAKRKAAWEKRKDEAKMQEAA